MDVRRPGAVRLVQLALAGSMLAALTAFLGLVHIPVLASHGCGFWSDVWAYRLRVAVFLCPFAIGVGLDIWAEKRFRRGYLADLWTEAELAQVRRVVERKVSASLGGAILLLWIMALFVQHSIRGGGLWYALILPSQAVQRIRSLITPRVERSSALRDWRSFGPLRSEHWGQR